MVEIYEISDYVGKVKAQDIKQNEIPMFHPTLKNPCIHMPPCYFTLARNASYYNNRRRSTFPLFGKITYPAGYERYPTADLIGEGGTATETMLIYPPCMISSILSTMSFAALPFS